MFYRLLLTGGPIDQRLAEGVVELILRGFAPTDKGVTADTNPKEREGNDEDPRPDHRSDACQAQLPVPQIRPATPAGSVPARPLSDPLPIHCWAIEHQGVLRLVDTGETAAAHNVPFGRMEVAREQELPAAISAAGLNLDDVSEVVLTHAHGDHIDGLVHVHATVLINETELRFLSSPMARVMRRILRQPLPPGFAPEPFALDGGPFGAFPTSRNLSDDGRIVAVPTPGHTPGHLSVICVHDSGRHVMLAGDATDTLEQLHARRADAIAPDPKVHIATLETIMAHCAQHPTIYLPSHDPDSAARLAAATTVQADQSIDSHVAAVPPPAT